jgi:hypothetical protein
VPTRVIWSDGSETTVDVGEPWRPLNVPGTDLFWRTPFDDPPDDGYVLTLVDITGEPVGPRITLPINTWPYLIDPASGGVIVANVSRSYAITPDGPEYLGVGEILGITDDQIVLYDCDEQLVCSLHRTDRATGEVTIVPPDPEIASSIRWSSTAGWGGAIASSISADGRWIAVVGNSWRSSVAGIIDLETGRFVELSRESYPPTVVFSPDSRYAFTVDNQVLVAFDTVTGERFEVFDDSTQWLAVGVRPVVPTTDPDGAPPTSAPAEEAVEG